MVLKLAQPWVQSALFEIRKSYTADQDPSVTPQTMIELDWSSEEPKMAIHLHYPTEAQHHPICAVGMKPLTKNPFRVPSGINHLPTGTKIPTWHTSSIYQQNLLGSSQGSSQNISCQQELLQL
jgi:hypothetical protein